MLGYVFKRENHTILDSFSYGHNRNMVENFCAVVSLNLHLDPRRHLNNKLS